MLIKNIIESVEYWAVKNPKQLVYQDEGIDYTYQQLKEYSDQLAGYLHRTINEKAPIVVIGELEFEMLVCFIGAVKAGFSYIPIDVHTPEERVKMIIDVARPAAVLAVQKGQLVFTEKMIALEELTAIFKAKKVLPKLKAVENDETFYTIFTSGTTGVPKGVEISHRNLLSFVNWQLSDFNLNFGMSFLAQAPYSFDLSVMSIYPALTTGGSLNPLKRELIDSFKQLFQRLLTLTVNVWVSTPSFIEICLLEPDFNEKSLPKLTHFLFCGEELTTPTAKKLLERFPQANVFNTYGPTEATVAISSIAVTPKLLTQYNRLPIGYVKEDTTVYIMDNNKEISENELGEIVIVGPSVSKGYLHNPVKTSDAFFMYKGAPAYRTGDLGKLVNNLLFYEGRMDFQLKLHGYRIELEDIDQHLAAVSLIKQAVVVPKYQGSKVQQLIAYVVPKKNNVEKEFLLVKAMKEELSQAVMDYMIPQKFILVSKLPLTINGKIDRKALIKEVNKK